MVSRITSARRGVASGRPAVVLIALGAALAAALGGGLGVAAAANGDATVTLKDIAFHKATTRITVGRSVTFRWEDGLTPHNVTPTGKLRFQRGSTRKAGSYTVKFTKPGTYTFTCTIHPNMDGKIVVSRRR